MEYQFTKLIDSQVLKGILPLFYCVENDDSSAIIFIHFLLKSIDLLVQLNILLCELLELILRTASLFSNGFMNELYFIIKIKELFVFCFEFSNLMHKKQLTDLHPRENLYYLLADIL